MKIPSQVPDKGFYYHYKHDPAGPVNNYAYELIGVGVHTEDDHGNVVAYLPLYESATVYENGRLLNVRPLAMWSEEVVKEDGQSFGPRFRKITDQAVIDQLQKIKEELYE